MAADYASPCGLPEGQCDKLQVMKHVLFSINIVVVSLTLILLFILQKYKFFNQRIFCNLLMTNLLSSIVYLGHDGDIGINDSRCIAQAFFIQAFDLCIFLWIGSLTIFLFLKLIKSKDSERFEWLYFVVCWILPIVLACLPLSTQDYGPSASPYCWIKKTHSGNIWRYTIYWGPVFTGVVIILLMFIYMIWHANRAMKQYSGDEFENRHKLLVRDYLKPLTACAASFVVIYFVQLVNRVYQIYHDPAFNLIAAHVFFISIYGIVLSILFIIFNGYKEFTPSKVLNALREHRQRWRERSTERGGIEEFDPGQSGVSTPVSTLQRNAHKANQQHIQDSQLQEDGLQPAHSTTDVHVE